MFIETLKKKLSLDHKQTGQILNVLLTALQYIINKLDN